MASETHSDGNFILKAFKKLFIRPEHPVEQLPPEGSQISEQERQERKARARARPLDIINELKRVTANHPARELLPRLDFTPDVLARNPELGNLLLNIIRVTNSSSYHDPRWLVEKIEQLHAFNQSLQSNPDDLVRLEAIEGAFEKKIQLAIRSEINDQRIAETEARVRTAKGEVVPQDPREVSKMIADAKPPADWKDAIDRFKSDPDLPDALKVKLDAAVTELKTNNKGFPTIDALRQVIEETMKHTVASMKAGNLDEATIAQKSHLYNQQREAGEKLGRFFVETTSEGSDLIREVQRRGGREIFEKAIHEDADYRDYWFYQVIENILYNQRAESSRELMNLYKMGDMDIFIEMVRKMKDSQGNPIGIKIAQRYTILKNTIFQSHDMDLYAAHPSQDMKEFIGSTSFFLNSYVDTAHQDPMVSLAKRLYEMALLTIRESNNGFIPREYLNWHTGRGNIFLDAMVERLLKQAIAAKQLYGVKTDPVTGAPDLSTWDRLQLDPNKIVSLEDLYGNEPEVSESWRRQLGDLKIAAALKQAKGLALVDMRLLEIIGRSKGTGNDMDRTIWGQGAGFNSVPYEGIVRHIEPIIHYFTRYQVGAELYAPFFNMLVTDRHDWNPEKMKRLIQLHLDGDRKTMVKEFGDEIDTRLNAMENPLSFSGMWGTFTKWRTGDATRDMDDWEVNRLSTANKLSIIGDELIRPKGGWEIHGMTDEKKTEKYYLEEDNRWQGKDKLTALQYYTKLRNSYRERLRASGDWDLIRVAADEAEFEKKWRKTGLEQKVSEEKTYKKLLEEHLKGVQKLHPEVGNSEKGEWKEKQMKLERAFKARIWIQAVMRSPLIVARELQLKYKTSGFERQGALRKKIIYDLLGIDLDELAVERTPQKIEREQLERIMDLEGAVAAVSQISIRENRDLRESDFDLISDTQLKDYSKRYWRMVRQAMLGSEDINRAQAWYRKIGIMDPDARKFGFMDSNNPEARGLRFYKIDWQRIEQFRTDNIGMDKEALDDIRGDIFKNPEGFVSELMTANTVDKLYRYLFSTEDMGWEYLNMGVLGERNQVRRAGDLASHVQFNQLFEQYLNEVMKGKPKVEDLVAQLKKMWIAMAGDFGDVATDACGRVAYTTGQMYRKADWAWKIPGLGQAAALFKEASIMQMIKGRVHGAAWGPNEMKQFVDEVVTEGIVPHHLKSPFTGKKYFTSNWHGELLEERLGATTENVLYELITLGVLISIAITLYRAFTAKSEEEEGGGGGGGG